MVAGEIGLAGEVRAVHQTDRRLREAARMGFSRAIIAGEPAAAVPIEARAVTAVREAIGLGLVERQAAQDDDDVFSDLDEEE